MSRSTTLDDVISYLKIFYDNNNRTPKLEEWKISDGFPCGKRRIVSIYKSFGIKYNDLLEHNGYEVNRDNTIRYNDKDDLRNKIIKFTLDYYDKNGYPPALNDWIKNNGFPCNKESLLNVFETYNAMLQSIDLPTYEYGKKRYSREKLLKNLRDSVLMYRSVDFRILKQNKNLDHRDVYTALFGNVRNALKQCEISNNEIYLMKMFPDYKFENANEFLIDKLFNGSLTDEAQLLIDEGKELLKKDIKPLWSEIIKYMSSYKLRKTFKFSPIFIILCDQECGLSNKQQYRAKDGHLCDSYEESIVDDFLTLNQIPHEVHIKYPNKSYICDFKIKNCFIEYIGYKDKGKKKYMDRLDEKRECLFGTPNLYYEVSDTSEESLIDLLNFVKESNLI